MYITSRRPPVTRWVSTRVVGNLRRLPRVVGAAALVIACLSALLLAQGARQPVSAASVAVGLGGSLTPLPFSLPNNGWPAFDGGGARSGNNTAETIITQANVNLLTQQWHQALPAVVDGTVVEQPNVTTSSGVKTLLFATTVTGSLIALDAASGALVWHKDHPAGTCKINGGTNICYTTSTPAIDPIGQYVYTYGLDGYVHKHATGDGTEVTTGGWPELVTLKNFDEKGSSALNIGGGYLYVMTGGYPGDAGDYQGHLVAINLSTGAQKVFNMLCSNQAVHFVETPGTPDCSQQQAGVWARAEAVIDPLDGTVYIVSGNGAFDPANHHYGDTIIKLSADGSSNQGTPLDTYTPSNYQNLQFTDTDLGSTVPLILPPQPGSLTPYLLVQSGKDANLRLINRKNMSGQGGPNHTGGEIQLVSLPQGGEVLTQPVAWTDTHATTWVFVANDNGLAAFKVVTDSAHHTTLQVAYQTADSGSSPFIAGNVLYVQGNNVLRALNPATGAVLWSTTTIGGLHWQSPLVFQGHVYVPDNSGYITAFGLPPIPMSPPTAPHLARHV